MKKLLLSALALGSALAMNAQFSSAGLCDKGAYDDFATDEEYAISVDDNGTPDNYDDDTYKGIFWWQDQDASTDFETSYTRAGNGKLVYDIYQAAKAYEPFGVGFGNDGPNGEGGDDFTIDLSENAEVSFTITNTSTETIEVKVAIQDVNGITLGFDKAATVDDELYLYEIGATSQGYYGTGYDSETLEGAVPSIAPGESFEFSYDYKNATAAHYDPDQENQYGCNNTPVYQCDGGTNGDCFDYSQVKALTITVVNNDGTGLGTAEECYSKNEFDGTVELTDVKIGMCVSGLFDFGASSNDFEVYPNPATDNVNFAKRLTNVEVYNAQGSLVETMSSANALNVSSYEAGVYFIKATEGTSRVVVK